MLLIIYSTYCSNRMTTITTTIITKSDMFIYVNIANQALEYVYLWPSASLVNGTMNSLK